jgi:exoribonuclease-2
MSNRELNLSPKRAVLISESAIDMLKPRVDLLARLSEIEEVRKHLKKQVDVRELWELTYDERESFQHEYLAQLVFGETITDDHLSALMRALFEDRLYFRLKEGRFRPNSVEKVAQIVKQREEEALKEERLIRGGAWLKAVQMGEKHRDPDCKSDVIQLLTQLALYGNEASDYKHGKALLDRADIPDIREARNLLVKLGVWDEDENLDIHRVNIQTSFSEKQLNESVRLAGKISKNQGREDLRHLPVVSIDGPLTRDFDDALSLEVVGDTLRLGVHIADVASLIEPSSILDRASAERALSIYFPRRQIPMIPPNLSEETLSLKKGCDRYAVSLLADMDKNANLIDYQFVPSIIRVKQNLRYDMVNEDLATARLLQQMYQVSRCLRDKRTQQGAMNLSLPELQVKVDEDASISLQLVPQDTPSRLIVAEFMILYNWLAAKFCKDNQVPILFRTQHEPTERLSFDDDYLYYVFKQRRKLNPLLIDTCPKRHSGLGLDVYTHVTSPIRRYLDIVVQRQIVNVLMGRAPLYDEKGLNEIRISVEPVIKEIERVKRNRIRYWILKFLRQQHQGDVYSAMVLDQLKNKYRILLEDFLLIAEAKRDPNITLKAADHILVKVKKADPWEDTLELDYAG